MGLGVLLMTLSAAVAYHVGSAAGTPQLENITAGLQVMGDVHSYSSYSRLQSKDVARIGTQNKKILSKPWQQLQLPWPQ